MVELLEEKYLDCSQGEVIASLINLEREWPQEFNDVSLALQVRERDDQEGKKDWMNINICVFQSEDTEPSGDKAVLEFRVKKSFSL